MDLLVQKEILSIFGQATGLFTSLEKCLATPIHCTDEQKQLIQDVMHCEISEFPCRYLGVLLSISKLKKNYEQALVDAVASRIPTWKGKLLNRRTGCHFVCYPHSYVPQFRSAYRLGLFRQSTSTEGLSS